VDNDNPDHSTATPPTALRPFYRTPLPNDPIQLYEGPLVLTLADANIVAEARGTSESSGSRSRACDSSSI